MSADDRAKAASSGAVTPSLRRTALAVVLLCQSALFLYFLPRPVQVLADNVRYETAGDRLRTGHGLSLPDALADPTVRGWVCDRHPEACADGFSPSAMYPPGYEVLIAAVYGVQGRSPAALAVTNWVCLLLAFASMEMLAARFLVRRGYLFAMGIAAIYPFLALQATLIMSDQLHTTLLLASLAALLLLPRGLLRGASFGFLLACATLTRPYCLFALPALFLWRPLHRALGMGVREWLVAAVLCALPLVGWTARNAYWFGRFIPFTTTGLGAPLYNTAFEAEGNDIYDPATAKRFQDALYAHGDAMGTIANQRLKEEAIAIIRQHPIAAALQIAKHVPKLWVSLGHEGQGRSRAWPLLVLFLGGLLVLGVAGMWLTRGQPAWHALTLTIVPYWAFLVPLPAEARRTLPLRLPMLLLGAFAFAAVYGRLRTRRTNATLHEP